MTESVSEYLEIGVLPSGHVFVSPASIAEEWTWQARAGVWRDEPGIAETILLDLAASVAAEALPAAWNFWREFALLYVTALCHAPEDATGTPPTIGDDRLTVLAASAPPMPGGEYLSAEALSRFWHCLDGRMREEASALPDGVAGWLRSRNPAWRLIGKVCFHLAENRKNPDLPFAFLATYAPRLSNRGAAQRSTLPSRTRSASSPGRKTRPPS